MRSTLILIAPALLLASGPVAAQTVRTEGTVLDISAEGHVTRVPDIATIRAGVTTEAPTAAAAMRENAARMARILAALKRLGVAARDIRTDSVSLNPRYRYAEGQAAVVTGYQATNTVAVRFRDIAQSGAMLDVLVAEGANQIDGPTLTIEQSEVALDEARVSAIQSARARAALYAKAAGLSVDRIVSIAEGAANAGGPPQPPVLYARSMKDSGPTRIVAGETELSVTLSVRFLLK